MSRKNLEIALGAGFAAVILLAAGSMFLRHGAESANRARDLGGMARLKSLAHALYQYAGEHGGRFPERIADVAPKKDLALVPGLDEFRGVCILAYGKNPRTDGKINVLFLDGSAQALSVEEFKEKLLRQGSGLRLGPGTGRPPPSGKPAAEN